MSLAMGVRFGTDGIRGVANAELTPDLVLALGRAAARVLGSDRFVVGRDTRRSGPMLGAALSAGLASEGVDVTRLGVVPTPAVAWASAEWGVPGAVVSASHNPAADNGIKFFAAGGRKLGTDAEARMSALAGHGGATAPPTGSAVGTIGEEGRLEGYEASLASSLEGRDLDGLSVVLDCAHGSAYRLAPALLRRLGADVRVLNAEPDGLNINQGCGSGHPQALAAAVPAAGADAGLAFDGDADRVVAVDHRGEVVDGDQLMALCVLDLSARGRLRGRTVVVTVMTNLGFHLAMAGHGVEVVVTPVGDRHILEALEAGGWSLGGEQSGHVVFRDLATTGDGILTGLQVLDTVRRSGRSLAELASSAMTVLPQVLRNVTVADRTGPDPSEALAGELAAARAELGEPGRVLVRRSGTEPVVRVMVEAPSVELATAAAERISHSVVRLLGAPPDPRPAGA